MNKRGRKPQENKEAKEKKEDKYYFGQQEEEIFKVFILSEDINEKEEIFNNTLKPIFTKLIESIIRTYDLYIPAEDFDTTFNDAFSFLITKLEKFNIERNKKAYSYFGTICKRHLMGRIAKYKKNQIRNVSYGSSDELNLDDRIEYSYIIDDTLNFNNDLINKSINKISEMLKENKNLKSFEIKIGEALIKLLENWETILGDDAENDEIEEYAQNNNKNINYNKSNKYNKSSFLYYMRETTLLSTSDIRKGMKKFKTVYFNLKNLLLQ